MVFYLFPCVDEHIIPDPDERLCVYGNAIVTRISVAKIHLHMRNVYTHFYFAGAYTLFMEIT